VQARGLLGQGHEVCQRALRGWDDPGESRLERAEGSEVSGCVFPAIGQPDGTGAFFSDVLDAPVVRGARGAVEPQIRQAVSRQQSCRRRLQRRRGTHPLAPTLRKVGVRCRASCSAHGENPGGFLYHDQGFCDSRKRVAGRLAYRRRSSECPDIVLGLEVRARGLLTDDSDLRRRTVQYRRDGFEHAVQAGGLLDVGPDLQLRALPGRDDL